MKEYLFLLLTVVAAVSYSTAQEKTTIDFEKTLHDFGTIKEDSGNVDVSFNFKNTGRYPLVIKNVVASCGCTTPTWPKDTIKPGMTGKIVASYNPMYRPGPFNKSISVISNADPDNTILIIKGEVSPRIRTFVDFYPQAIGNLRFSTSHLAFGNLKSNETDTFDIKVFNAGKEAIRILSFSPPAYLRLSIDTSRLKPVKQKKSRKKAHAEDITTGLPYLLLPGREATITGVLSAQEVDDFGWVFKSFDVMTDDAMMLKKQLHASTTIEPYFPMMTVKDSLNAPKISFATNLFEFDTLLNGETVDTEYEFTNNGKNDLKILKVKTSCGCVTAVADKTELKTGEKAKIKVTFNSAGKSAKETKTITIVSNDPVNTMVVLTISGYVKTSLYRR